jgi:hypothetical protein
MANKIQWDFFSPNWIKNLKASFSFSTQADINGPSSPLTLFSHVLFWSSGLWWA